jgi:protease-4
MKKSPWITCLVLVSLFFVFVWGLVFIVVSGADGGFGTSPVRVVKIEGPIFDALETLKELDEIGKDNDVKAVVLRVDSPGGEVGSSQEIYEEVLKLKKNKVVIASMGNVAASGGYYIACAGQKVLTSKGTVTGSIGVIMESVGIQDLLGKLSVENRTIKSGAYKDAGSPFRAMTEGDKLYLQNLSDNLYHQFLSDVAKARNISMEKMATIAQGKIYSGEQAKELGLVDDFGNLYDAIALAKKMANLPDDAEVKFPKEPGAIETFFSGGDAKGLITTLAKKYFLQSQPLWLLNSHGFE